MRGAAGPGMAINGFLRSGGLRCTEYRQNPGSRRPFRGHVLSSGHCSQKPKPLCLCAFFAPKIMLRRAKAQESTVDSLSIEPKWLRRLFRKILWRSSEIEQKRLIKVRGGSRDLFPTFLLTRVGPFLQTLSGKAAQVHFFTF